MAKPDLEHRRSEKRLDQHIAGVASLQHPEQTVERKTMPRIERQQNSVINCRRLDFEIEALAEPFSNREAESAIQTNPKRRVDDDLGPPEAVEKSLDDHGLRVGRNRPLAWPRVPTSRIHSSTIRPPLHSRSPRFASRLRGEVR